MDLKIQDGNKISDWNHCWWLGTFWGFSDDNSSLVANVWNLTTRRISPQYHIFGDFFRHFWELGKINQSLMLFVINFLNTINNLCFMLRTKIYNMVNWYILPRLWVNFCWINLNVVNKRRNWHINGKKLNRGGV